MKFVEAECPNCGAQLHFNSNTKTAFCNYCGSEILVDNAIELANSTFISLEKKIKNGETLLKLNEYAKAQDVFDEITEIAPERYEGWLGLFNAKSIDGRIYDDDYCEDLKNALQCVKGNLPKEAKIQKILYKYDTKPKNTKKIVHLEKEIQKNKSAIKSLNKNIKEGENSINNITEVSLQKINKKIKISIIGIIVSTILISVLTSMLVF